MTTRIQPGVIYRDHALKRYTAWNIGGPADVVYCPKDLDDLVRYYQQSAGEPVHWLGLGSNVLISDAGIEGHVLIPHFALKHHHWDNHLMYVQAGCSCAKVAKWAEQKQQQVAGFLAGIPGTMGGALAMNAGAFGFETWDFVEQLQVMTRTGDIIWVPKSDFEVSYRAVKHPYQFFVGALLDFSKAHHTPAQHYKTWLQARQKTQPIGQRSCGSVFKNPTPDYAAQLIEQVGLKGHAIKGVQVSEKHANFIINIHQGRAQDVVALMNLIQHTVFEQHQVVLIPEVKWLGRRITQGAWPWAPQYSR